jgi:hypothetical protein
MLVPHEGHAGFGGEVGERLAADIHTTAARRIVPPVKGHGGWPG